MSFLRLGRGLLRPIMGAEQICRLPGRTEARPYDHIIPVAPRRDPTSAPYYVDNQQPALHHTIHDTRYSLRDTQ